ncbi:MAG: cation:proton antiporter [Spirochaetota bacterium]
MGIAEDLIIIILVGLFAGLIANKIKIPPIIGYIIAGIIIGPYTGSVGVSDIPRIELLAEIGVALLLFSIGLDFSFKELKEVKAVAFIGTPIQILLLIAYGLLIGRFFNMPWNVSLVFGMIISLSSTMVVLKTLMNRGLIGTLSSKVMIGILIMQDLAAIPLMLVIPKLNDISSNLVPLALTLVKALVLLSAIIFIGIRIIPWFLKNVAKLNSRELFLITVTAIGLGVGYLTHLFGLSLAFGAFVAGMVINNSDYSHKALNDIIPLRDIFGLIFFTSIGMLLNPVFVYNNIFIILILVILVIAGKFIVFSMLSLVFKYFNIIPLALGFGLAQVGEFSFVLARTGLTNKIIDNDFYSLVLSVSVVTMIISPFLSYLAVPVYSIKKRLFKHEQIQTVNIPDTGLNNHIVIAGGGRVGFEIASMFRESWFPFIILEQDFRRFEQAKEAGFPVIYGDAAQETVISASRIKSARLLIITIPSIMTAREIAALTLHCNPKIKIIARADNISAVEEFYSMNIFDVVQPEFEASLEIIRQSLLYLDIPFTAIYNYTDKIRRERYASSPALDIQHSLLSNIKNTPFLLEISWIEVRSKSSISGKSMSEAGIRAKTGVSVVGILRQNEFLPNPDAGFIFRTGDYVAVIGLPEDIKRFKEL